MRKPIAFLFSLVLVGGPVLPAFAASVDEPAAAAVPAAQPSAEMAAEPAPAPTVAPAVEPTPAPAGEPAAAVAPTPDPNVPEAVDSSQPAPPVLPSGLTATAQELDAVTATAATEAELPTEILAKPGEAQPDEKPARYKFSNFALGFLGGALLGSAAGVLFNGQDSANAGKNAAIFGVSAGFAFGATALFLGATTPEEAKPPKVEESVDEGPAHP